MRISELSRESGLAVPTIKYYLREELLQPGRATAATQAEYGPEHVERLRLVRALAEVGRLPLSTIRAVLTALETAGAAPGGVQPGMDAQELAHLIGTVYAALPPRPPDDVADLPRRALAAISTLGWAIDPDAPALRRLESALEAVEAVGLPATEHTLRVYADAALAVATADVGSLPETGPADIVRHVVIGTVLYEPVLTSLRRLAMQHVYRDGHP